MAHVNEWMAISLIHNGQWGKFGMWNVSNRSVFSPSSANLRNDTHTGWLISLITALTHQSFNAQGLDSVQSVESKNKRNKTREKNCPFMCVFQWDTPRHTEHSKPPMGFVPRLKFCRQQVSRPPFYSSLWRGWILSHSFPAMTVWRETFHSFHATARPCCIVVQGSGTRYRGKSELPYFPTIVTVC